MNECEKQRKNGRKKKLGETNKCEKEVIGS